LPEVGVSCSATLRQSQSQSQNYLIVAAAKQNSENPNKTGNSHITINNVPSHEHLVITK
jgi:hypothetical protein